MAKPDFQARPGQRGGTTSESSFPNGEASRRGSEERDVDDDGKTPAKDQDAAAGKGAGDDWGAATRSGMSTEAKVAILMVLVLCGASGYVFYRKMDKQKEVLATVKSAKGEDGGVKPTGSDEKVDPQVKTASQETEGDPFAGTVKTTHGRRSAGASHDEFGGQPHALFDPPKKSAKAPKAPPVDDGDPFGNAEPTPAKGKPGKAVARKSMDEFDSEFEEKPRVAARAPAGAMNTDEFEPPSAPPGKQPAGDEFEDPFAGAGVGNAPSPPSQQGEPEELGAKVVGLDGNDEFGPSRAAPRSTPIPRGRAMVTEPQDFGPQPKPVPRPTTEVDIDDFGPGARSTTPPRAPVAAPPQVPARAFQPIGTPGAAQPRAVGRTPDPFATASAGNDPRPAVYEVQPNDNYWTISKKQYGTYKYFVALHRFNADRIPDATKLRPGMKVMTPAPQVLESRFPDLFAKKSAPYAAEGDAGPGPGFLRAPTGQPLYRVGEKDTLTTIARDHLGRSSRWIQIYEMNRDQLQTPENLKIGTVLRLPLDASSIRVSGRTPDSR